MRRALPLLALAVLATGGCGQKGPLYLPDKGGRVVTSAPAAATSAPTPPPATPAAAPPGSPQPTDKSKDQDSQPPK